MGCGTISKSNLTEEKIMIWMTQMENIVMNLTGCNREIANTVVNSIYSEIDRAEKEDKDDREI